MDVPSEPIPPILNVRGRDADNWHEPSAKPAFSSSALGAASGLTVVSVDEPQSWTYRITDFRGPLAALPDKIEAEFRCNPAGTGTNHMALQQVSALTPGRVRVARRSVRSDGATRARCSRNCRTGRWTDRLRRGNYQRVVHNVNRRELGANPKNVTFTLSLSSVTSYCDLPWAGTS